jgi:hypothetical protein
MLHAGLDLSSAALRLAWAATGRRLCLRVSRPSRSRRARQHQIDPHPEVRMTRSRPAPTGVTLGEADDTLRKERR